MESIGVRELRADLAAMVRRAGAGHRIVVSVGGRPAAQLGPIEAADHAPTLADLIARGLVEAPRRTDEPRAGDPVPVWSAARLDRLLGEVRGR